MTSQHNTQSQVLEVVTQVDWVPGAVARNHFISSIIGNLYNQNEQKLSELNFVFTGHLGKYPNYILYFIQTQVAKYCSFILQCKNRNSKNSVLLT